MARVTNEVLKRYQDKTYRKYTIRVRTDGNDGITPEQLAGRAKAAGLSINAYVVDRIANGQKAPTCEDMGAALLAAGIDAREPAAAAGETVEQFIIRAVENQTKRDKLSRML